MTNPTTEAQMREAFEKWAKKERPCWNLSYSHELCSYEFVYAEDAWRAWQAASAIPPGYVVVPVETAKDAERLDWMQFHGARVAWGNDGELCRVMWSDRDGSYSTELFDDWREAIDAATKGKKCQDQ